MWPQWLIDALSGKTSLARAFWLYGIGVSVVYSLLGLYIDLGNRPVTMLYLFVGLALGVLQTVILWRSAPNSHSRFLGRLVRTTMICGLVLVAVMVYVLFTNWSLFATP